MSQRNGGQIRIPTTLPARGYDRCEKCRSQHVKCDGTRPSCKRCHEKGHICIYKPKRSPWTVYTNPGETDAPPELKVRENSALSDSHPISVGTGVDPGLGVVAAKSRFPSLQRVYNNAWDSYTCSLLYTSPDPVPGRWNWSGLKVDVYGLLDYFFPIDAGYIPNLYLTHLVSSKDLIVSYASLPALYHSIVTRRFETDPALLNIRGAVLQSINTAIRQSGGNGQVDDATIISIKHQLYYDCFISSKEVILAHLNGLEQIVRMRGGLQNLGLSGDLAHMLKLHTLMAYVIIEHPPPREYLEYKTQNSTATESISAGDVSYCPLLPSSTLCKAISVVDSINELTDDPLASLHNLVLLLQQLTANFLLFHNTTIPSFTKHQYQQQQSHLYNVILQSPPATFLSSPQPSSNPTPDPASPLKHIYESCRLAGVIYAAALYNHIPFSSAITKASHDLSSITTTSTPSNQPSHPINCEIFLKSLTTSLFNSPYSSTPFWGSSLTGCFLWVSLVAASLSQWGVDVEAPDPKDEERKGVYWLAKSRRAALVVPFSFATKLFHIRQDGVGEGAWRVMRVFLEVQGLLGSGRDV